MIGGGHQKLTGALLHDWAMEGLKTPLTAWVESLGGKLVIVGGPNIAIVEETQTALTTGRHVPLLTATPIPSLEWDNIDVPIPKTYTNPAWVLLVDEYAPQEPIILRGPKGGERARFRMGWHYLTPLHGLPDGSWVEPTELKGVGSFCNSTATPEEPLGKYAWLWGFKHVAGLHCDLGTLAQGLYRDSFFNDIVASMFNNMLVHIEAVPKAKVEPPAPTAPKTFETQLAKQQALMAAGVKDWREELEARIKSTTAAIADYQQEIVGYQRALSNTTTAPNLQESLQAIIDRGLCSAIKQDNRGLWFLFDDIHAVVSAELAALGTERTGRPVVPGIYKIIPAVVHLPWGRGGDKWTCGTLTGGTHPHPHAGNSGAFGSPCFGSHPGTMGPVGVTNAAWFAQLWDQDPIKWAETIHAFMRQTGFEYSDRYRGIWECGTLVQSHEPTLKITKLPTPKLTITRTRAVEAMEGA